ncbi:MAG: sugar ABC transporter permease [Clostridia bacterium]|nr:sugar ABC transporter permease [Clostridia bacterium]
MAETYLNSRDEGFIREKIRLKRKARWKRVSFITTMLALPVAHYLIFFFYINFNSFFMCFKGFDYNLNGEVWVGVKNFVDLYYEVFRNDQGRFGNAVLNSFEYFFVGQFFSMPLGVLFAYFFFKEMPGYKFFRMVFFIPSLIPGIVMPLLYGFMLDSSFGVLDNLLKSLGLARLIPENGWFGTPSTAQFMLLFYTVWGSFGGNIILITGNLNRMPTEVFESAKIDGCPMHTEFIKLVMPLIWPTFSLLFVQGCMGIFTIYMPPFILTKGGPAGSTLTIGYIVMQWTEGGQPYMAATAGIVMSAIGIPLILLLKRGMSKIAPVVEF